MNHLNLHSFVPVCASLDLSQWNISRVFQIDYLPLLLVIIVIHFSSLNLMRVLGFLFIAGLPISHL